MLYRLGFHTHTWALPSSCSYFFFFLRMSRASVASAWWFLSAALTVMKCLIGSCQQLGDTGNLETRRRHGSCMQTHILYTLRHTHLVTPEQLPATTNYCSSHMAVHLKPVGHVWIDLWCGPRSTNRQEAEILKTALQSDFYEPFWKFVCSLICASI